MNTSKINDMDMKLLKERLEKQHAEVGEKLTNIYLPHDTVLLLLGKRAGLREAINEIIRALQEQPVLPEGLEEAADAHIRRVADAVRHRGWDLETQDIAEAFIAGAEWDRAKILEWAKERYQQTVSNTGCYTGHSVWAEVIEKLESL